jgi:hypothetical protein
MQIQHTDLARGLRIAIRHANRGRFLERQDVFEVWPIDQGIHQRQLGGARVAENILNALLMQDF